MITIDDFVTRGHQLYESEDGRREILDLMLSYLKSGNEKKIAYFLHDIHRILFGKARIFWDSVIPNLYTLQKKKKKIQKEFLEFFLKENIDVFTGIYSIIKHNEYILSDYLPVLVRFLPVAEPPPEYFVDLFLILCDVLTNSSKFEDKLYRQMIEKLSIKALYRYMFDENLIAENFFFREELFRVLDELKGMEAYPEMKKIYRRAIKNLEGTYTITGKFDLKSASLLILYKFSSSLKALKNTGKSNEQKLREILRLIVENEEEINFFYRERCIRLKITGIEEKTDRFIKTAIGKIKDGLSETGEMSGFRAGYTSSEISDSLSRLL